LNRALANKSAAGAPISRAPTETSTRDVPHTRLTLLAYGGLALPLCLAGLPILTYLPAFYAQELHLSTSLVGVVFLFARIWDAVSNVLIGWLSDHSTSRWGRRKPWVIIGAPFLMVSTWCLCNPPQHTSAAYLAIWVTLFYTAWAVMYVPYLSWGTELATEYAERSRVTSFRETFTMLGNLFFAAGPLIFLRDAAPLSEVLLLISLTLLLTVPLTTIPLGLYVRDSVPMQRVQTHPLRELIGLGKARVMIRFILATLLWAIGEGVANSLLVFFYGVGLQLPNRVFWGIFILYVATLCAMPAMLYVAKRVEKHRLLAIGVSIQMLVYGLFVVIPPGNFANVVVLNIVLGIANSAMLVLPTSILADIIDHGHVQSGRRSSGAYVAIYNLALKLGMALGVGLAFFLLAWVNYEPAAPQHSATDVKNIRLLAYGLPFLLQTPVILLYFSHPVTRRIQQQLRERIQSRAKEF
jgi:glycoside/pentoside/hexuronide:cation symporter, GPH family